MAPRTWCPAGIFGLSCPLTLACSSFTIALTDCQPILLVSPTLSLWMVVRSVWIMQASLLGEPEEVALGPMGVVAATPEVVGTRAMGVAGIMTVDLEGMDMDMDVPETIVAETRVVMTATQEEITETIMTTEMRHAHNIDTQGIISDPGSSFQMAVFIKVFGAALKHLIL
ncbi:RNA-binding protein 3 isoform X1 [Nomascus leucogenys]|uniref:RNA-binding protein 3 isoform X1 n=1 Tax=Nomascus leucogenys TaxID=61853 RepID=UPI00122D8F02|nr:RNA-binding protein 3 isoform X1 [Nomascus leucogenys]XP_030663069.1 RNA-binding protein 3 isoform X1 [Nomascus leucogenys]